MEKENCVLDRRDGIQEEIINSLIEEIEDEEEKLFWKRAAEKFQTKAEAYTLIQILKGRIDKIPPVAEFKRIAKKYNLKLKEYFIEPGAGITVRFEKIKNEWGGLR
jgi:hypothetical protein